ncbi:RNA-directed DNA polymerase, eukaryota [Tanacetum coccineum]
MPTSPLSSKSYVAALSGDKEDKTTMVIGHDCLIDKDLDLTLIAKVKDFDALPNLRLICNKEGFQEMMVRYMGSFWVLLKFTDSHARNKFKEHMGVNSWFSKVHHWYKEFVVDERVLWIDIEGIPSIPWTPKTFNKIAERWGELLFVEDPNDNNVWKKRLCIKMKTEDLIFESFKIVMQGHVSIVRAREITGWIPNFIDDDSDLSKEGSESPLPSDNEILADRKEQMEDKNVNERAEQNDTLHLKKVDSLPKSDDPFRWEGEVVVTGDFNEMRKASERLGSVFDNLGAVVFNGFISGTGLVDVLLAELDKHLEGGDTNPNLLLKRTMLVKSIMDLDRIKAVELAQKAKVKWAVEGDENTKLFHDRFSKPSGTRPQRNLEFGVTLSHEQASWLDEMASGEEIKSAVWECEVYKSPGPDGFTFEFIRKFWDLIGVDVIKAVKEFFTAGLFPRGCNPSFIALIPKCLNAKSVKDFCPVSLIGCQYQNVGKILAKRLSSVIGNLISTKQSAFIHGRQILDGTMILNEVMSWCKVKMKKAMGFKVDFKKAYDSVRWDFLDDIMQRFGFGRRWRGWIAACLSSANASILVNGSPTEEFRFFRGLRQGDHLSPFLFLLVMEAFHVSFSRALDNGFFLGIRVGDSM